MEALKKVKVKTHPAGDSFCNEITVSIYDDSLTIDDNYDLIAVNIDEVPGLVRAIVQAYNYYLDKNYISEEK